MSKSVIESDFEYLLRILLLLNEVRDGYLDKNRICLIDFMAIYAKDFNLNEKNINGYSPYRFGEYFAKKRNIPSVIKKLMGFQYVVAVKNNNDGKYGITDKGKELCKKIANDYADDYVAIVKLILTEKRLDDKDVSLIETDIKNKMYDMLGERTHE